LRIVPRFKSLKHHYKSMNQKLLITSVVFASIGLSIYIIFFVSLTQLTVNPLLSEHRSKDFFIYMSLIPLMIFFYRFRLNQGHLQFLQGLGMTIVFSLLMGIGTAIFLYFFLDPKPDLIHNYSETLIQNLSKNPENGITAFGSEAAYKKVLIDLKSINHYQIAMDELYKKVTLGLLIGLLSAIILRKRTIYVT
jgi:Protein of unknown function (DUF4199)